MIQTFAKIQALTTPATTTLTDCLGLLAMSLLAGLIHFLLVRFLCNRSRLHQQNVEGNADPRLKIHVALLVSWLPWLLYCLGTIVVSLIRDRGGLILWPILTNCSLLPVWLYLANRVLFRCWNRTG